ncbi:hypothetical protein C8250_004910 [Streptomyces sp. So13.3]|uniref:hypothetical protein n=1 Tax=Streptomyces TaxID=1883 RepID=UPI001106620D|nr:MULTISPECIES: hypothetical protein [Streptomyces]MCZ4095043.1 hypothetical protein [Streptomyces sp. H39-C1]QNA71336.1 hypothetical protein C8250_004910 [Streptomyces sp. So13.3]
MLKRVSFQYQRFVTHTDYEQVRKLGDRKIHVDGGPDANGFMVESKWTGNENQWASSQYNPAHTHDDESKITSQAEKLLDLNDALGGNGLRYAISSPQGAAPFPELLSGKFPEHFADGRD